MVNYFLGGDDLNEELMKIVKKIGHVCALHRMHINKEATCKGFYPGQMHMLRFILKNSGCTQNELAKSMHVTPASIAVSVKRMEKSGLVERKEDEKDRRIMRLFVTEKGEESINSLSEAFSKVDEKMFSHFSCDEIKAFEDFLDRICENLTPENASQDEICEMVRQTNFDKKKG